MFYFLQWKVDFVLQPKNLNFGEKSIKETETVEFGVRSNVIFPFMIQEYNN